MIIFDEIHQLSDPTKILKIGADLFPHIKLLVTGSSTLFASKKFKDMLTGRKRVVNLLPVLYTELDNFKVSLDRRLFHGGLPPSLLSQEKDLSFYREWSDSFFSRDIQKLYGFKDYYKFNHFFEYIMLQSGGIFEVSKASSELGISRPTIGNYIRIMEVTGVIRLVRPFFGRSRKELIKTSKIYAFDTGFISFFRGWQPLRNTDKGILWEHIVLEWLLATNPYNMVCYWRDKSGNEIDFVIQRDRENVDIFECKWNIDEFSPKPVKIFRSIYPKGSNYLISPTLHSYKKQFDSLILNVTHPFAMEKF
jgi:predicted AAA+ superfamily ATPase